MLKVNHPSTFLNIMRVCNDFLLNTAIQRQRNFKYVSNCCHCLFRRYSSHNTYHSYPEILENTQLGHTQVKPKISSKYTFRSHTCGEITKSNINQEVKLCGWVHFKRMHHFILLRDRYGIVQLVIPQSRDDLRKIVKSITLESVITAKGCVHLRPAGQENPEMSTGEIEIVVDELSVLSIAKSQLPFNIREYNKAKEALQMKHRYLALRFPHLQRNIELRSKLLMRMREYLCHHCDFLDVETPTLFRRTPGGAQEFVVPTREVGLFYSLVQSPQQLKQLLMVGGLDRYFQVARCYRDEGARPDRQPEFTQLDIEMSFVDVDGIINLVENLLKFSWPNSLPHLSIPFPRMTYQEALEKYGTDKPDTRFANQIRKLDNILSKGSKIFSDNHAHSSVRCLVYPKEMYKSKSLLLKYEEEAKKQYPSTKLITLTLFKNSNMSLEKLFSTEESMCLIKELNLYENLVFLAIGPKSDVLNLLGHIRLQYCKKLCEQGLLQMDPNLFNFLWVYDFPLFTRQEQTGELETLHHPFTQPHPDDMKLLNIDATKVRGLHYDLVLNGCEIAGGSIRIHDPQCQIAVLEMLGIDPRSLQHMLDAFQCGCPPHGGIALGIDRLISLMCNANSLREVIAFPKGFDGKDPMSGAPSTITGEEMELYHIKTTT